MHVYFSFKLECLKLNQNFGKKMCKLLQLFKYFTKRITFYCKDRWINKARGIMENSIFFMWWFDVMQMSTENPNVLTNRATQYPHSLCPLVSVDQTTPTSKPISIWSPFSQKMLHFEHVDYEGSTYWRVQIHWFTLEQIQQTLKQSWAVPIHI